MAMPTPIPRPAPVTMATCSSRRKSLSCISNLHVTTDRFSKATNERDLAAALLPDVSQAATLGYGEHREFRTLVQPYAAHRFELRPVTLGDERHPAVDHPADRWQVERGAMRRLVAPRLQHPDPVEVVAVLADHIQLAAVRALQLPRRGDEQLEELLALSGLGHQFAHHAESSHHASFR